MSDVAAFINEANQATQLYRESQCRGLLRDVELTAGDIARSALLLRSDSSQFNTYFSSRSKTLGFNAAAIMQADGTVLRLAEGSDQKLIAKPDPSDFQDALSGEALCGFLGAGNVFVGIRPIPGVEGQFLYAAREVDPLAVKVAEDAAKRVGPVAAFRGSPPQFGARLCDRLCDARADHAVFGHLAWPRVGEPSCRSDPPAHSRRRRGGVGQSRRSGAGPRSRRRSRPSRDHVQQDDGRALAPTDPIDRGERPERRAARLH